MARRPHKPSSTAKKERLALETKDLLVPIVEFLQRSGFSQAKLATEWQAAIKLCGRAKKGVKVVHIGYEQTRLSLVTRWLRDPNYLNHAGRPDDLPLNGTRSVASLLKESGVRQAAADIVLSLIKFGTVKKIAPNRYRLVHRSVNFAISKYLPFEPNFQFLVDAVRASTWGSGIEPKAPRLFWQNVVSDSVPPKYSADFLRFAKDRGLSFLHEINDWLEAHETSPGTSASTERRKRSGRRLGIGLFGVHS